MMKKKILFILLLIGVTACKNNTNSIWNCDYVEAHYFLLTDTLLAKSSIINNLTKLKTLAKNEKNCSVVNISIGDLYRRLGNSDSAYSYYERAFVLDTLNFYAAYILGYMEENKKNFKNSFEFYDYVISSKTKKGVSLSFNPTLSSISGLPFFDVPYNELRLRRGLCLFKLGDYLNAISDFNYCISKNEYLNEAYKFRSLIYLKIDEMELGEADSLKSLKYVPSNFVFNKCQSH